MTQGIPRLMRLQIRPGVFTECQTLATLGCLTHADPAWLPL